jgi:hypothetical protein
MKKHRKQSNLKRVKGRVFERQWIELAPKEDRCVRKKPTPKPQKRRRKSGAKRKSS